MKRPGYVYIVGRETKDGAWAKVGVAARIGRVLDHESRDWSMLERTFETDGFLADPHGLEQAVLGRFSDAGSSSGECGVCHAPKPPVGRNGRDGLTEVRHLACYPGLPAFFAEQRKTAERLERDATWLVDFGPRTLSPGGFLYVGEWRQPPRMDSNEYQGNTCNVLCVRGVSGAVVLEFLDREWEAGTVDLRKTLWKEFGGHVCKTDGTTTPNAKGSGASGERADVERKLAAMAAFPDVEIVLASVRKPGVLYAYLKPGKGQIN
jgi:hypothetical protein